MEKIDQGLLEEVLGKVERFQTEFTELLNETTKIEKQVSILHKKMESLQEDIDLMKGLAEQLTNSKS